MKVYVVSAFTCGGEGGNRAGVVLDGKQCRNPEDRQRLAADLGFSETVFAEAVTRGVVTGEEKTRGVEAGEAGTGRECADFRLVYYTPAGEVPVCGHATVAFFAALRERRPLEKAEYRIETGAGVLRVRIEGDFVYLEQCLPEFGERVDPVELEACFAGLHLHPDVPPRIVSTGLRDILLPVRDVETLASLNPDFGRIAELSRRMDCVGIHAFAFPAVSGKMLKKRQTGLTAVCRNFAPLYGIDEESATGTSNAALACYLYRCGIGGAEYRFGQGYNLNRISEIRVRLTVAAGLSAEDGKDLYSVSGRIESVFVGGTGRVERMLTAE